MITTVGALILATVCGTALAQSGLNFLGLGLDPSSASSGGNQPVFNVGNINQDPAASSSSGISGLRFDSMAGASGGGGLDSHLNLGNQALGSSSGLGMGGGGGGGLGDLGGLGGMGGMGGFGGPSPSLGNRGLGRGLLGQRNNFGNSGGFGRSGGGGMWGQQQQMPLLMLMMNQMFW